MTETDTGFLNELVRTFPNMTVIDIASILQQIQGLLNKIGLAIQYLFLFTLAAGVLIFITSLEGSMDERKQTYQILRTLGASKKYIMKSLIVEFVTLAGLVILISLLFAKGIAYIIVHNLFS